MSVLFPSSDKLPIYPRTAVSEAALVPARPVAQPWGVGRMKPFKARAVVTEVFMAARMELDPFTQVTIYYDASGNVIEAGKHSKTYQGTEDKTTTAGSPGDGQKGDPDTDFTQDADEVD